MLSAFSYSDGTQMLTVTGILAPREQVDAFLKRIDWASWPFPFASPPVPHRIAIPNLSTRERHAVDKRLPSAPIEELVTAFGFISDEDDEDAGAKLASYAEFYRFFPHFGRIVP
jgi:hypothetical protein